MRGGNLLKIFINPSIKEKELKPETLCDTQEENVEILEGHYTVGE
jgi:hypothetical protein